MIGVVLVFRDIAVRKQVEEQLRYSATHDHLTGLPNRAFLMERLAQILEYIQRYPEHRFALLLLDLDDFKAINDSLGHMAGDQTLVAVTQRLGKALRTSDILARLGGDEFVILLAEIDHTKDALQVAERIQSDFKIPINLGTHEVFTSVSIGIVFNDADYQQPDEILRDADTALYRAKATGKGRNVIFDYALHERAMASLRLENNLRQAIERKEFLFMYQPIVSLTSREIYGFEALLRWQHPEQGFLLPHAFLEFAEETGSLNEIGERLIREACGLVQIWQRQAGVDHPLALSVNLSEKQFRRQNLAEQIGSILAETEIDPHSLCLEIPEGIIANPNGTYLTLKRLHDLGIQLHMDDFGTGCSSLSALQQAPIDMLKISRAFVQRLDEKNRDTESLTRAILLLAHELKKEVIAEGIETEEQAADLKRLDCQYGQGYLFSEPLPADEVTTFLSAFGNQRADVP
jgi:diguanylate cyclase (GGDEF)-like protein